MGKRKYTHNYTAERAEGVYTHEFKDQTNLVKKWGISFSRKLPTTARDMLKRGDIVRVIFLDDKGHEWYRYVKFNHYSGNRVIGAIIDWYGKYQTNIFRGEKRWTCSQRSFDRFNDCNIDYCEQCYDPKKKYCGHQMVEKDGEKDGWVVCDGKKCIKFPEGMIVTFHKSSIETIYDYTKNGEKIYKKFRKRKLLE